MSKRIHRQIAVLKVDTAQGFTQFAITSPHVNDKNITAIKEHIKHQHLDKKAFPTA